MAVLFFLVFAHHLIDLTFMSSSFGSARCGSNLCFFGFHNYQVLGLHIFNFVGLTLYKSLLSDFCRLLWTKVMSVVNLLYSQCAAVLVVFV